MVVNDEVETRREVGDIATEGLVGVDRNRQTIQVEPIVRFKELLQVGIFVTFYLSCGETD